MIAIKNTVVFLKTCSFVFVLIFAYSVKGQQLVVVQKKMPRSVIIISDTASEQIRYAAKFLQEHIQQSTGATLIITSNNLRNMNSIHIGNTGYVRELNLYTGHLDEDGFIFHHTDSKNFVILGGSDWGTEFGVYSFLEKFLDIQFLMPTKIGTDIPDNTSLFLPKMKLVENPVYISRQLEPIYSNEYALGKWGRENRLRGRIMFSHNLWNLYNPREFSKTNPDFFMSADTSNEIYWQPNFSAAGIADTGAAKIIRYFHLNPKESSYSLGVNDSYNFDQSPASLKRRNGTKNYLGFLDVSDDYFKWANEVVEKVVKIFPKKMFGLLAWNNLAEPPSSEIGVHSNIIPFITYERMRWTDPSLKFQGQSLTRSWGKEANVMGWYDYTYGLNYLVPRVWFKQMQEYLKWGAENNVKYYFAESYPNWGEGPKLWVQAKLLWNPGYDVDSLLNIWYVKTAGSKAAPKLKEFYELWENFWTVKILNSNWNSQKGQYLPFKDFSYLNDVPLSLLNNSENLMNTAYSFANTKLQKERVLKLKLMWDLYKNAILAYQKDGKQDNIKLQNLINSKEFNETLNKLNDDPFHSESTKWIKMFLNS